MKKNKFFKKIITIISIIVMIIGFNFLKTNNKVYADVGNYKSYSSSGGRSSSRSSSRGSYSSGSSVLSDIGVFWFAIKHPWIFLIIIIILTIAKKNGNKFNDTQEQDYNNLDNEYYNNVQNESSVINSIKSIDPNFNSEEFKAFARDVYIRLQAAWSKGDWEDIRTFESNELFEQHRNQLQEYLDKGQLNKMDRVAVLKAVYSKFEQQSGKDILSIDVDVKQVDYIIDTKTNKVILGNQNEEDYGRYRLTFTRTTGNKTNTATGETKITNCPNCGAPTTITSSGKCPYCGSVITTTDYGWVLSDLNKIS